MRPAAFAAFFIAFRTENFRFFSAPQKFSSEIVRDRAEISPAGRRPTSAALQQVLASSAEHWHDAACGIRRIFKRISERKFSNFFSVPQKFSSEIVRDRAEISPAGRRPTSAALPQVLTRSAEHWHDAACGFCRIFHRVSDRKFSNFFRCRKNFHPQSCEIAQESARPDNGGPPQHSGRSLQGRRSTGTTRRAGFVAFFIAFRTEIFHFFFGAAKFFIRNRARSRRNQPKRTTPDLRGTPPGPHKVG